VKVALIGNVAWNASILARGLRALGVEADSFDNGGGYFGQAPQWERGTFSLKADYGVAADEDWWAWDTVPVERYPWEKILGNDGRNVQPWYDTQEAFQRDLSHYLHGRRYARGLDDGGGVGVADLTEALAHSRTPEEYRKVALEVGRKQNDWRTIRYLATQYDLTVLFGAYAQQACFFPKTVPYITFEHGTMRYVSSLAEPEHKLMAVAYQQADWNVITNADVIEDAGNLGIRHKSSYIPHPVDETRFTPGEAPRLRASICDQLGCEFLLVAPARHSKSERAGSKRNDRIIHALAKYVREAEPDGAPKAGLVMFEWGDVKDVNASILLTRALGIGERVLFEQARPRPVLLECYRAADVVLDQFSDTVGSFGTTTVEAMSSGKPVISYYNPSVHEWCLDVLGEHPPILTARTVDEIYERLVWQAKHERYRQDIGKRGRAWVERHHSLERVSKMHKALYEQVLAGRKQAVKPRELVAV
jgi:glycosyltransferase involved in cell wall biosynthesis